MLNAVMRQALSFFLIFSLLFSAVSDALAQTQLTITKIRVVKQQRAPTLSFADSSAKTAAIKIAVGTTYTNKATSSIAEDASPVVYQSSDPSVATVDAEGVVNGIKPGVVSITASQAANPPNYLAATPIYYSVKVYSTPITSTVISNVVLKVGGYMHTIPHNS